MSLPHDEIVQGGIDAETGEMTSTTPELDHAARDAANAYVKLSRARTRLADVQYEVERLVRMQFPELAKFQSAVERLERDYQLKVGMLRMAALDAWRANPTIGKTLFGGAITIAEAKRITHYSQTEALDFCEEVHPELVLKEANKAELKKLLDAGEEIPNEVMTVETVAETRIKEDKLSLLIG